MSAVIGAAGEAMLSRWEWILLYILGILVGHGIGEVFQPRRSGTSVAFAAILGGTSCARPPPQALAGAIRGAGPAHFPRHGPSRHPRPPVPRRAPRRPRAGTKPPLSTDPGSPVNPKAADDDATDLVHVRHNDGWRMHKNQDQLLSVAGRRTHAHHAHHGQSSRGYRATHPMLNSSVRSRTRGVCRFLDAPTGCRPEGRPPTARLLAPRDD
jgi:hypothetical protein